MAQRQVRLLLSHCGLGVALESVSWGKPVLCMPAMGDQWDVGARMQEWGVGRLIRRMEAGTLRREVERVFGEGVRRDLGEVRERLIKKGGVLGLAERVEELVYHGWGGTWDVAEHTGVLGERVLRYSGMVALVAGLLMILWNACVLGVTRVLQRRRERREKGERERAASTRVGSEEVGGEGDMQKGTVRGVEETGGDVG